MDNTDNFFEAIRSSSELQTIITCNAIFQRMLDVEIIEQMASNQPYSTPDIEVQQDYSDGLQAEAAAAKAKLLQLTNLDPDAVDGIVFQLESDDNEKRQAVYDQELFAKARDVAVHAQQHNVRLDDVSRTTASPDLTNADKLLTAYKVWIVAIVDAVNAKDSSLQVDFNYVKALIEQDLDIRDNLIFDPKKNCRVTLAERYMSRQSTSLQNPKKVS